MRDGTALEALFDRPVGLAADSQGNIYVADSGNHVIRRLTAAGSVETVAGSGREGTKDGPALEAEFRTPVALAFAPDGTLFIVDSAGAQVRSLRDGQVRTVAGIDNAPCVGAPSKTPGAPARPEECLPYPSQPYRDGPAAKAVLGEPSSLAIAANGDLYFVDGGNNAIRKIDTSGNVSLFAGTRTAGFRDGPRTEAMFFFPVDIVIAPDGSMFITEAAGRIRRISTDGQVTTVAGPAAEGTGPEDGNEGYVDGAGVAARFKRPTGIALAPSGEMFVVDGGNQRIRKVGPGGVVTTVAGKGGQGFAVGSGGAAQFSAPMDIIALLDGSLYVSDYNLNRIFKVARVGQ